MGSPKCVKRIWSESQMDRSFLQEQEVKGSAALKWVLRKHVIMLRGMK